MTMILNMIIIVVFFERKRSYDSQARISPSFFSSGVDDGAVGGLRQNRCFERKRGKASQAAASQCLLRSDSRVVERSERRFRARISQTGQRQARHQAVA